MNKIDVGGEVERAISSIGNGVHCNRHLDLVYHLQSHRVSVEGSDISLKEDLWGADHCEAAGPFLSAPVVGIWRRLFAGGQC